MVSVTKTTQPLIRVGAPPRYDLNHQTFPSHIVELATNASTNKANATSYNGSPLLLESLGHLGAITVL